MTTGNPKEPQIIQAGKQLLAEDKSVTPFAIRNLLGGGNHLRIKLVWEAAQHAGLPDTVGWDTQLSTISPKNRHIASLKKYQFNAVDAVIPVSPLDPVRQQLQDMDAIIERLVHLSRLLSESRCQLLARFENNIADRPDLFPAIRQDDN